MKIIILQLTTLSILTSVTFGQTKYIQSMDGSIVDTPTYEKMKAEKVEKLKSVFPSKDIIVTLNDDFKEVRRTKDSLIYSYNWDIKIGERKAKENKSFEP